MSQELIQLARFPSPEGVEELLHIIAAAKIPFQLIADGEPIQPQALAECLATEILVIIRRSDGMAAHQAIENEHLKEPLEPNHYLLTSSDEEIAEILVHPETWSGHDVAHARKIARERNINLAEFADKQLQRRKQIEEGKPASLALLITGWFFALAGGLVGLCIGWGIYSSLEKTSHGEFHVYNQTAREHGKKILFASTLAMIAWVTIYKLGYLDSWLR